MAILLFIVLIAAAVTLVTRRRRQQSGVDWQQECEAAAQFSLRRFEPMRMLLSDDDFIFLASRPGYNSTLGRQLRTERRRIFRQYLAGLTEEFDRLYRVANYVLIHSHVDRPDLAHRLLRMRLQFAWLRCSMELRLCLHAIAGYSVPGTELLNACQGLLHCMEDVSAATAAA